MVFGTILEGMKFVRQIEAQNGTPPKEAGSGLFVKSNCRCEF